MRRRFIIAGFVVALIAAALMAIAQHAPLLTASSRDCHSTGRSRTAATPPGGDSNSAVCPTRRRPARSVRTARGATASDTGRRPCRASGGELDDANEPGFGAVPFGYNPAPRQPIAGDHDLKQARAALALAQAAKFCGDEKQAAIASQAVLTLLTATKIDPDDPNCRVPIRSSDVLQSRRLRGHACAGDLRTALRRCETGGGGRTALRLSPQAMP